MNDSDLKHQHDSIIQKLRDVDEQDFQTKTGLVRELIDVSRPLLKKKLMVLGQIYLLQEVQIQEKRYITILEDC